MAHEFTPGERVYKVVDFGLANMRESRRDAADGASRVHRHDRLRVARAAHRRRSSIARSDIYSLGAVVFEMLTGRVPFRRGGSDVGAERAPELAGAAAILDLSGPAGLGGRGHLPRDGEGSRRPLERHRRVRRARSPARAARRAPTEARSRGRRPALLDDLRDRRAARPGTAGQRSLQRHAPRARPSRGDPAAAPGQASGTGKARARDSCARRETLQVAHPSIIQVRDYGEEPDLVYLVTDFIEGPSLRELMNEVGPLPGRGSGRLADAAGRSGARRCTAARACCAASIPTSCASRNDEDGERLMISSAGIWQAQDLLATLQEQTLRGIGLADAELRYVAPELLTGRTADVRSDIFTMGVLAYEMATGTLPFDGASMPELLGTMLRGTHRRPRATLQPTLPEAAAARRPRALHRDRSSVSGSSAALCSSVPRSVPRSDDRIRRRIRLARARPAGSSRPARRPTVARSGRTRAGQRLRHVDAKRAGRQLALGRGPCASAACARCGPSNARADRLDASSRELLDLDRLRGLEAASSRCRAPAD